MPGLKKIVILGPESTGKSTLCKQLAINYDSVWVPEYAREYLGKTKGKYTYEDLLVIAKGQLGLEEKIEKEARHGLLFIDTNMHVMKVWAEFVFDKCHTWILEQIAVREYSLYLLCDIDLPWVKDELREYPDIESRRKLFRIYKDIIINQDVPWEIVSGNYEERLLKAIQAVDKLEM